ncbi:hypothetical protein [Vibrio sp. CJQ_6]|uniref:hypothetical protein n=1 Tax=Vibrio sp. CJQ_6 TaxID=3367165 RepID=UPI00370C45FD
MATASLRQAKKRLIELGNLTGSPVFAMSRKIVEYLEDQRQQDRLTIGGLRAALSTPRDEDRVLAEAAFMLTIHPFEVLDVQYRLYDESLSEVIEIISKNDYAQALSAGEFYYEGELIDSEHFQSRVFPVFLNQKVDSNQDVTNIEVTSGL